VDQLQRQPFGLPAKNETIARLPGKAGIPLLSSRLHIDKTGRRQCLPERFESAVLVKIDLGPVIDAGATQSLVVNPKPEPSNEVQSATGRRAEAGDIARIRGDFGLEERYVEEGKRLVHGSGGAGVQGELARTIQRMTPPSAKRKTGRKYLSRVLALPAEISIIWRLT